MMMMMMRDKTIERILHDKRNAFGCCLVPKTHVSTELYSQNQLMALSPLLIHSFYRLFFARIVIAVVRTATFYTIIQWTAQFYYFFN
jgi:hypothetical protein